VVWQVVAQRGCRCVRVQIRLSLLSLRHAWGGGSMQWSVLASSARLPDCIRMRRPTVGRDSWRWYASAEFRTVEQRRRGFAGSRVNNTKGTSYDGVHAAHAAGDQQPARWRARIGAHDGHPQHRDPFVPWTIRTDTVTGWCAAAATCEPRQRVRRRRVVAAVA
jgi:hypothetical protein